MKIGRNFYLSDAHRPTYAFLLFRALSRRHLMVLVVIALVFAHQEFQACQECLDRQDQQVLWDHPENMDPKEPWAHEESREMKVLVEIKA